MNPAAGSGVDSFIFSFLILGYVILIGYLGWRGWKKTQNSKDYLLAGRSVNPFVMAMS